MLDPKKVTWTMIYRKMMQESESNSRYVVTLLRKD